MIKLAAMQTFTARAAQTGKDPTLVFDVGGVLLDWSPLYLYTPLLGSKAAALAFLEEIDFSTWNQGNDRGTVAENVGPLCEQFPQYAGLIQAYDLQHAQTMRGPDETVVAILRAFSQAGWSLWCLSNFPADKYARARRVYPFYQYFEGVLISGELGLVKPEPAIYQLLLEKLGHPAGECLFVDDNPENIQAAQALGFETIRFHSADQLLADLQARGLLLNGA